MSPLNKPGEMKIEKKTKFKSYKIWFMLLYVQQNHELGNMLIALG